MDGEFVAGVHHMELLNQRGRQEIQRQRLPEIQWVFTRPQDFIKSRHHTPRFQGLPLRHVVFQGGRDLVPSG